MTHGQCDARPTLTFPAAEHHRPLTTGTKLHCLANSDRCVWIFYTKLLPDSAPTRSWSGDLSVTSLARYRYITKPHKWIWKRLKTRDRVAGADIARLVWMCCEHMLISNWTDGWPHTCGHYSLCCIWLGRQPLILGTLTSYRNRRWQTMTRTGRRRLVLWDLWSLKSLLPTPHRCSSVSTPLGQWYSDEWLAHLTLILLLHTLWNAEVVVWPFTTTMDSYWVAFASAEKIIETNKSLKICYSSI